MVHRREIDGRELVLGNHGALWGNAMTWFDHGTGSVWSQPLGEAILGPLTGQRLELLPSTLTRWGDWRAANPDTFALAAPSTPSGFDLETMALVVEFGPDSVAFPVPAVRNVGVIDGEVGTVPVAVVVDPDGDNWAVFSRTLDDRVVALSFDAEAGVLRDSSSDDTWDPFSGLGLDGTAQNLDQLPGFTSFPGDYITFFPDGAFWQPDGLLPVAELEN